MARKPPPAPKLPPPTAGQCWAEFLKWALGVPLLVAGGLALILAAYWAVGDALSLRAEGDMIGSLMWLGLLVLLYPPGLVVLVLDLRDGLRAAREWRAMPEAERTAALERQAAEAPPARKRRTKRRGEGTG